MVRPIVMLKEVAALAETLAEALLELGHKPLMGLVPVAAAGEQITHLRVQQVVLAVLAVAVAVAAGLRQMALVLVLAALAVKVMHEFIAGKGSI